LPKHDSSPILMRRGPSESRSMNCPACQAVACRRSRRRSIPEYLFSAVGVLPWRCLACETRFHARVIPLRHILYARCGICGNLELQRISREKVTGAFSLLGNLLRLPALRCAPCRHKFFSLRPLLPAAQLSGNTAEDLAPNRPHLRSTSSAQSGTSSHAPSSRKR
jgi:hypothetical protein